jgi:hypothetical protein
LTIVALVTRQAEHISQQMKAHSNQLEGSKSGDEITGSLPTV